MAIQLLPHLIKWIIVVLIALVLFGATPATDLVVIAGLFLTLRLGFILVEAGQKKPPEFEEATLATELQRLWERLSPEQRAGEIQALGLPPDTSASESFDEWIARTKQARPSPRAKKELLAESFGVVTYAALLPLGIALSAEDFFSFRNPQGWIGASVFAACLAFYAAPHFLRKSFFKSGSFRVGWWAIPFCPALYVVLAGIANDHPHLNPFHPEQRRLAAERVLALDNFVVAGNHADWVFRYARDLDRAGDWAQAIFLYTEALRLDANLAEARSRLLALKSAHGVAGASRWAEPAIPAAAPYWEDVRAIAEAPRRAIDRGLETIDECIVMIVPVGDVAPSLLNAIVHVIQQELGLPAFVSEEGVPLPPHTRVPGLAVGPQWHHVSLISALQTAFGEPPRAPVKYVIVTAVDIYHDNTNYLFSTSYPWGGVVSFARYEQAGGGEDMLYHRTAKQVLGALLKSFDLPASPNRACVTSYTRSVPEFDAKGNRPDAATMASFRETVAFMNHHWRIYRLGGPE